MSSSSEPFEGKVVIVTGACGGIGAATAARFAAAGARIVAADIDAAGIVALEDELEARAGFAGVHCDVTTPAGAEAAAQCAITAFGRIDVLANVAGGSKPGKSIVEMTLEEWQATLDFNLTSTFLVSRAVIPSMSQAGAGAIVNIASGAGLRGMQRNAAYVAAKGGVIALTRALAMDHAADGIRVNCVSPGPVLTPLMERNRTPAEIAVIAQQSTSRRLAGPAEIASVIAFLASDAASYIQGETLNVDGGFATLV